MINWWAWNSNLVVDSVTGLSNTAINGGGSLVSDRKGRANSALYLASTQGNVNTGYYQLPSATYFSGTTGYSITVWVNPQSYIASWARIIDCASSTARSNNNNVLLTPSSAASGVPTLAITNSAGADVYTQGTVISLGTWYHLAASVVGSTGTTTTAYFYQNNVLTQTNTGVPVTPTVTRSSSFIGYSPWIILEGTTGDQLLSAYLDDLRIFNRALTTTELTSIYNWYA